MNRMLKVFRAGAEQDHLVQLFKVVERCKGFVLTEVPRNTVSQISC